MNAFSHFDLKSLRLNNQRRIKEALAKLPQLDGAALPELPALLKTVVGRLGEIGGAAADLPPAPPPPRNGARFETFAYTDAAGRHSYKLYVPSRYTGAALPLVVMLHGCTQSPDDFALGTRMNTLAEAENLLVAYPAQNRNANMQKCWNWFNTENQLRDSGEAARIAGITRQIRRDFAVRPNRIYVAGLSAGGALAAIMGATYPDLYAAIGVHSGLACGAAHDMTSAFAAMHGVGTAASGPAADRQPVPAIVFHGDKDKTVSPGNAAQVIAQAGAGATLNRDILRGEAGGVAYTRTVQSRADGRPMLEQWVLHGGGHAWSGGDPAGSFTNAHGPDASREMLRFFLRQPG